MKFSSVSLIAAALAVMAESAIAAHGPLYARTLEDVKLFEREIDGEPADYLFERQPPNEEKKHRPVSLPSPRHLLLEHTRPPPPHHGGHFHYECSIPPLDENLLHKHYSQPNNLPPWWGPDRQEAITANNLAHSHSQVACELYRQLHPGQHPNFNPWKFSMMIHADDFRRLSLNPNISSKYALDSVDRAKLTSKQAREYIAANGGVVAPRHGH